VGAQCIRSKSSIYSYGNINIILLNTSSPKTNIYLEGVAMFSLSIDNNIAKKYKYKNINLNVAK